MHRIHVVGMACALALAAAPARAADFPSPEQAVAAAFPGAEVERVTWALSEAEAAEVERDAGSAPESRLLLGWIARRGGKFAGVALADGHVVRSKRETLLVALTADLVVQRVEVLAFGEPREYLAPGRWLEQFHGRDAGDLATKGTIRGITGATMTARAATAAARRCVAEARLLTRRGALPAPVAASGQ